MAIIMHSSRVALVSYNNWFTHGPDKPRGTFHPLFLIRCQLATATSMAKFTDIQTDRLTHISRGMSRGVVLQQVPGLLDPPLEDEAIDDSPVVTVLLRTGVR